eukprot:TRINITY_DN4178_c0_g1_i1.p1 TRINITY_DN4178_c0_g1~~TRINITY_DN4178_c0_g1_i1.p1  ORF type:complete len:482 (+),score=140.25 TRINITY_DN4178_c0_g1_i1:93-1538(+)
MADGKAEKMKHKTEEARRAFNLPDTESVIQDYHCSLHHKAGRMYITANFIGWIPGIKLGATETVIPFRKVKEIRKDKNALIFDNALTVESDDGQSYFFSSFVHRDEVFNLLVYLAHHPPTYIDEEEEEDLIVKKPSFGSNNNGNGYDYDQRSSNDSLRSSGQQQQQVSVKVDTQTTKNALRIASQARETGTGTLVELTLQAEQLDRVETNIEGIHANLDKADRLLRGIESVGGAFANKFSKDVDGRPSGGLGGDRTLDIKVKELPPVDFEILEKLSNDHLQPAFLRLFEDRFMCADANKKPKEGLIWPYDKIDQLVLRARHQHLDIRFKDKSRFRLCTSDIQAVVNELFLRSKSGQVSVVFEPGTRHFPYGKASLLSYSIGKSAESKDGNTSKTSGFFRRQPKSVTQNILKNVDDETKAQLLEQEKDLDEISNILGDLSAIASTMGGELDRQTQQIDRISERTDDANERLYQTNKRITKML